MRILPAVLIVAKFVEGSDNASTCGTTDSDNTLNTNFGKIKAKFPQKKVVVRFIRHAESDQNDKNITGMLLDKGTDARLSQHGARQAMTLAEFVMKGQPNAENCVVDQVAKIEKKYWFKKSPKTVDISKDLKPTNSCDEAKFLNGVTKEKVLVATSSLSRAILTGVIGFRSRIEKMGGCQDDMTCFSSLGVTDRVHMLSSLEEATSGLTSQMSVGPCQFPRLQGRATSILTKYKDLIKKLVGQTQDPPEQATNDYYSNISQKFDLSGAIVDRNAKKGWDKLNIFSTAVSEKKKEERFLAFCQWAMSEPDVNDVIAVGHSNWIREFFISRLEGVEKKNKKSNTSSAISTDPSASLPLNEIEKTLTNSKPKIKLGNASVLKFEIVYDDKLGCKVTPRSTEFVFGTLVDKD